MKTRRGNRPAHGSRPVRRRHGAAAPAAVAPDAGADCAGRGRKRRAVHAQPVTVQIDFDGLQQRIISVPGVPERQYSQLRAGVDGTVYYLKPPAGRRWRRRWRSEAAAGNELLRYRLCDRRAAPFVNGVADYDVSADGRKLVYRAGGGGGGAVAAARCAGAPGSVAVSRRRRSQSAAAGSGPAEVSPADVSGSEGRVQTNLQRRLAQPARLSLRAKHARHRLAEDERDVRRRCCLTSIIAPISIT